MLEDWKTYNLSSFSSNVSRRFDFEKYTKVVFINTGDVSEGKFLNNEIKESHGLPGQAKKAILKGDILFSEIRPKNKRFAYVNFNAPNYVVSTKFMVIVSNDSIIDKKFFLQVLTSEERLNELQSIAEGRSGTFPQITFDAISKIKFNLPPLPEQKAIASILSAIDDKIELNLQMNKTLEDMAMTLYKHWFVDFGPFKDGKFVESELGMIPEGWEVKKMLEVVDLLSGGTPKTKNDTYWGGNIKWVSAKDIGNGQVYIDSTEKKITKLGLNNSSTKILPEDTVILVARGSVGKFGMISEPMAMNQSCYGLYSKTAMSQGYIYLMISFLIKKFKRMAYGSVFDTITTSTFKSTSVLIPPSEVMDDFKMNIDPIFEQLKSSIRENTKLNILRATLLPKLISGQVRLKEYRGINEKILSRLE